MKMLEIFSGTTFAVFTIWLNGIVQINFSLQNMFGYFNPPLWLTISLFIINSQTVMASTIQGKLILSNPRSQVVVQFFPVACDQTNTTCDFVTAATILTESPQTFVVTKDLSYTVNLPNGLYSIFAFEDINGDQKYDPLSNPAVGWWGNENYSTYYGVVRLNSSPAVADIKLKKTTPYPTTPLQGKFGGKFRKYKGFNVIHLTGTPEERSYDHGYLAGPQIIDWFRFYVLEMLTPPEIYEKSTVPFLQSTFTIPPSLTAELNAVIKGIVDSGVNCIIPELNRNFSAIDLFAINAYIEVGYQFPSSKNLPSFVSNVGTPPGSCTQFSVWGEQTVDGKVIAARNMDGEVDVRKLTVTHLTIFAIEPESNSGKLKYVSIMWPGFIGTLTSFNEGGLYGMMNTGVCASGSQVTGAQPVTFSMRAVIETLSATNADPSKTMEILNTFKSSGGGISVSGTIFHFARNFVPTDSPAAYFFEGDKYGGGIRVPGQVDPAGKNYIMGSNHNRVYGVDPFHQNLIFGVTVSYDSYWRYKAGQSTLEVWTRTGYKAQRSDMQDLLKKVCDGYTEHSVVWADTIFWLSNANAHATMWDAPYLSWTQLGFSEVFI